MEKNEKLTMTQRKAAKVELQQEYHGKDKAIAEASEHDYRGDKIVDTVTQSKLTRIYNVFHPYVFEKNVRYTLQGMANAALLMALLVGIMMLVAVFLEKM